MADVRTGIMNNVQEIIKSVAPTIWMTEFLHVCLAWETVFTEAVLLHLLLPVLLC